MADLDITQPNDYVPDTGRDTLPPSAIGRGGLSAMDVASHAAGSAAARGPMMNPMMMPHLMSLMGDDDQKQFQAMMMSRVRSPEQVQAAADTRRGALAQLQSALQQPENNYTGLDMIARGMAHNSRPWDVGNGFREGVAAAFDNDAARQHLAREAAIQSAMAQQNFNANEEGINDKMETNAITNLRQFAKPLASRMGGSGGAMTPGRWVPGTGYVSNWAFEDDGVTPKVLFPDNKMTADLWSKALGIANKQAESQQNNVTFGSDAQRDQWIKSKAAEYMPALINGWTPSANSPTPPVKQGQGKPAQKVTATGAGMDVTAGDRYLILADELSKAKNPEDKSALQRQIASLPPAEVQAGQKALAAGTVVNAQGDVVRPAAPAAPAKPVSTDSSNLAPDGSLKIVGPEVQAGQIAESKKMAESNVEDYTAAKKEASEAAETMQTINDLRQLNVDTGAFAKMKRTVGNFASALGVASSLAKQAGNTTLAEKLLQERVNERMTREHGTQTDSDVARFQKQFASITDPKEAWNYMLNHMSELAQKSQDHLNFMDQYKQQHGSLDGAQKAWLDHSNNYGALVKRYGNGSQYVGRSQFINKFINTPQNQAAYKGDTAKLRQRAEAEWNRIGGQ